MRNKIFSLVIVAALMSVAVCGCQKAPESSSNGDILHAKGSVENEVEAILNEGGTGKEENTLKEINCTIGTEDNAIRIQAQMPDMPENIYNMVLGENDTLTKDLLKDFLGSNSGTIDDLSEEVKKEREKLNKVTNVHYFLFLAMILFMNCQMDRSQQVFQMVQVLIMRMKFYGKNVFLLISQGAKPF